MTFRASDGARRLYERHYLMVEEEPDGLRRGVVLEIESTATRTGTPNVTEIGNHRSAQGAAALVSLRRGPQGRHVVIEWADFEKVDMRVGRIVSQVEDFPEARKPAWKLRIDFSREIGEKRSSAQITNYGREELEGRLVVAVVNFPPRPIGPVRSEVLVLGAVAEDHPVLLLQPDAASQPGDRIA